MMKKIKISFLTILVFLISMNIVSGFDVENENTEQKPEEEEICSQPKVHKTITPEKQENKVKTEQFQQKIKKVRHRKANRLKRKLSNSKSNSSKKLEEVILAILAVLLPPLAVFLYEGLSTNFWIDLILTLFFWLPGILFAFYVIFLS